MGEWTDKIKGYFKEKGGRATGDRSLENRGKLDRAKGEVKGGLEELKRDIKEPKRTDRY